jgi:recombination protein RecR
MFDGVLQDLIDELSLLPSVGPKSATRLAFYLLNAPENQVSELSNTLSKLKSSVHFCKICNNITDLEICSICSNNRRNKEIICVVPSAKDIPTIENTNEYNGVYHVLGGLINPINNIGPDDINIKNLLKRITPEIQEIIIALDLTVEGEATTTYLANLLKTLNVKVSRLASGIPIGSDLEYTDQITVSRALEGRTEL